MNRLVRLFKNKSRDVLSIYVTAGFPKLEDTVSICNAISESGADMIEIGMPFSDPVADGPTIQHSSEIALQNGMTLKKVFEQVVEIRKLVDIPILLMGYLNPVFQFGIEKFCSECQRCGVDGCILPDLPFAEFNQQYKDIFLKNDLKNIFLITPQSSDERILEIDRASSGFIYAVSSTAITG